MGRSGRTIRDFCLTEGVSEPSFYAWRKRLKREARANAKAAACELVPVRIVGDRPAVEIMSPDGWRIRLGADCPGELAAAALAALRETAS